MVRSLQVLFGVVLATVLLVGCGKGGGSSTAPEGAGTQGASDPATMTPGPAEISPEDAGGAPAAATPTTTP